ncbi:DotI/IcmL/TraM family protein [uncultured Bilophila sp.]|uniref:DotI/IcmL/TraM family protein n=1 Tax=uncultured Bilophila sp. TaxID=529385 RepID=UPI0026060DCE|nr:DotI/IcmL/TraM family protein [uncultured Bilophila sp.]
MNIFKKQKDAPKSQEQAQSMKEVHASSPAPDAAAVIGGLNWYRAQFRRAMKLALGLTVTLCASTGVVALLLLNQPKPQYFAATPDLRLGPMISLDQPLLTQEGLLTWVSDTIAGAMSLNFLEWRKKLESIRPHFDDAAYKSFLASLQSSGVLDMIRDKRLSASAVATRAPVIIASGLVSGKATWKVEFPLIVSYESSQGVESTQKLLATVLVCRASTAKTPRGVVIQQVVLKRDA